MDKPQLKEIRAELERRRVEKVRRQAVLARSGLEQFTAFTFPGYQFGWFNRHVCSELDRFLEDVIAKKSPRLILEAPPRSGKSELASRRFPARAFGVNPDFNIIATSYGAELAQSNSRDVQRIMDTPEYGAMYPAAVLCDGRNGKRTNDLFEVLDRKGSYRGAGVGGPITGLGFDIGIIDDPIKDGEEGESETIRKKLWDWYQSTFYTRRAPGAGILAIMTRWHQADPVGMMLKDMEEGGEKWRRVRYPAIAEEDEPFRRKGEALQEDRFSVSDLAMTERTLGAYRWASLYQQRPTPREGGLFTPESCPVLPVEPLTGWDWVRGWDFSGSVDGDWTVGAKVDRHRATKRFCVANIVRFRGRPDEVEKMLKFTADGDGHGCKQSLPQDPGQAGLYQAINFTKLLAGHRIHSSTESGSKETRAEPFAAQVNVGNVDVVAGSWLSKWSEELRDFPNGVYDDQVDASSRAFNVLLERPTQMRITPAAVQRMAMPVPGARRAGF